MKPERPAMASTLLLSALLRVTADGPSLTICNPAVTPVKYLKMSNGGPISSPSCSASWDLHEVEFFDQHGNQIFATADTTTGSSWRGTALPSNTLDGDLSSYWAGDHDHGLSCSCWSDEKMDVQAIDFTLPEESYLSRIEVYQGHNEFTMLQLRLKCAGASGVYGSALELNASLDHTSITCNASGCASELNTTEQWYCGQQWNDASTSHYPNACGALSAVCCLLLLVWAR
ncbi:unnamed protein product [Cladocopium goreaui]|uniref:Uncharacterized protein n=1 Tax=Cladocopium goreaui TaxID=2562237 RepID=A0A9P1M0N1_9DINO|nr:unnamed protein product [Cladocopium goreaui]